MKIKNQLFQLLQRYGLKPPTLADEVSSYVMLLIILSVLGISLLAWPSYTKLHEINVQRQALIKTVENNERAITNRSAMETSLFNNQEELSKKQAAFVQTQVDSEIMRSFMDLLSINNLNSTSISIKPYESTVKGKDQKDVLVVQKEGSPFAIFQMQVEVTGSLTDILYFTDDLHKSDSYTISKTTLRRLDEFSNPYNCNFNGSFTVIVYTVNPV